ncbi:MAG TPA: D-alanine--D-alanine ligase family protein [Anaerolineae bacterium]|nr:D-alanine--D-alanine ligase family protein [Anaerolineae bacterium]
MTKRKIRVGVIFGGKSGEHEVSLMSAKSIMRAIDKSKYEVVPIGITSAGRWLTRGDPLQALTGGRTSMPQLLESGFALEAEAASTADGRVERRELVPGAQSAGIPEVEVIFPVLHGTFGEDGTVQGLLELADIPYVGAGVMASAVGMDKAVMKDVLRSHGLPVVDHVLVKRSQWEAAPDPSRAEIATSIGYPCFVKPANLGSSVGISKAHSAAEIEAAIALAAQYDRKVLVEKCVEQAREIEVSVLGNDDPIVSIPGEVIPSREFYDYAAKYLDDASELVIPAPLEAEVAARIRQLAREAFLAFDCAGMARVDFLLSRTTGALFISEVNTIPGFTSISMYPKLWEASGIPYAELIDRLIELALERHADKQRSRTTYTAEQDR